MTADWRRFVAVLVLLDAAWLVIAGWIGMSIHQALSHRNADSPLFLLGVMLVTGTVILTMLRAYDPENLLAGPREYSAVVRSCIYGLAAVSLLSFVIGHPVSREWIGVSWVAAAALLLMSRYLVRRCARALQRRGRFVRPTLLVGADANSVALAAQLNADPTGMRVVGFLDDYHRIGSLLLPGVSVVDRPANLNQVAIRSGIRDAIIVPQALPWETLNQVITAAATAPDGPRIHVSAGYYDLLTTRVKFSASHDIPLLTVNQARLTGPQRVTKGALDYVIAAALLIACSPAVGVLFVWQRVHGQRRIVERRRVVGATGTPFDLLTFRSTAPFESSILRKLPGLLNVLAGQLTIVGPRPIDAGDAGSQPVLMAPLRPGLTGLWREVEDPAEQSIRELYYIRAYSVTLDLQVLVRRARSHLRRSRPGVSSALSVERSQ
jgi:lipopolysaccharide/colanic/teichoic acid biosynthesis glycosyltransferase